jgi:hypothetical protein
MATIATVLNRFFEKGLERAEGATLTADTSIRVRSFANEDIYFYVKRIDNSGVVREADPQAGGTCWKMIGSVVAASVLAIGVMLPSAYGLMAGFQIQSLRQEGQRLVNERASLEIQEASLVTPARMEELARKQQFVDPAPEKLVYLDGSGARLAKNAGFKTEATAK